MELADLPAQAGTQGFIMDYFVYILKSNQKRWFYAGLTKDINNRLTQHNLGKVLSTKAYRPFQLMFVQITNSLSKARDLEKYLKVKFNKEALLDVVMPQW